MDHAEIHKLAHELDRAAKFLCRLAPRYSPDDAKLIERMSKAADAASDELKHRSRNEFLETIKALENAMRTATELVKALLDDDKSKAAEIERLKGENAGLTTQVGTLTTDLAAAQAAAVDAATLSEVDALIPETVPGDGSTPPPAAVP